MTRFLIWALLLSLGCSTPADGPPGQQPAGDDDAVDDDAADDDAVDDDAVDDDDTGVPDDDTGAGDDDADLPHPLSGISLYINVGDSLAAGYDATGNNGVGGRGYARLLVGNHSEYPAYAAAHLTAVAGGVDFYDVSESGAQSGEILDNLDAALGESLPASTSGDVLLTISAGGNDFNDSVWTMVTPALTAAAASTLQQNLGEMIADVRGRYEVGGKQVHVVLLNIQDPTGGTCSIPDQYDEGFCETLQNGYFQAAGFLVLGNLDTMNQAIADAAASGNGSVADLHQVFFDHGMNETGSDLWLSDDCAHPNNTGHHEVRREIWGVLTGDWF